jgi:ribosomal protein L7/L12
MNSWVPWLLTACIALGAFASFVGRSAGSAAAADRRLARIERRLALIMEHLEIQEADSPLTGVIGELEQGNKIKAIKLYREQTGAGLAEAKSAVDVIARERGL